MLAKNAVQNPDTLKPGTVEETSSNIRAFMTSTKNPNVRIVNGMVSSMTTGLMMAFAKPRRSADMSNACLLENEMPWNMKLAIQSDTAVIPQ